MGAVRPLLMKLTAKNTRVEFNRQIFLRACVGAVRRTQGFGWLLDGGGEGGWQMEAVC